MRCCVIALALSSSRCNRLHRVVLVVEIVEEPVAGAVAVVAAAAAVVVVVVVAVVLVIVLVSLVLVVDDIKCAFVDIILRQMILSSSTSTSSKPNMPLRNACCSI